jgi:hypothetical protein
MRIMKIYLLSYVACPNVTKVFGKRRCVMNLYLEDTA